MAVATNWFDSHSFIVYVFIFKSTALKLSKRRESLLLDSFGILLCNRHILIQKSQRIKE